MEDKNKKPKTLSWDDFTALGNPENAPEIENEESDRGDDLFIEAKFQKIRIYLDRKKRKGKGVTIIEGLEASQDYMETLTKEFKKKCGVGGSVKDGLILIQGDQKNRLKELMINRGFKDTKISGG